MKRFTPRRPGPWITRHQWVARSVALVMLLTIWLWLPLLLAWEHRDDVVEVLEELVPMAFLPWRERG